jgi:hypothetical protein
MAIGRVYHSRRTLGWQQAQWRVLNGVEVSDFTEGDRVPAKKLDYEPERGPRPEEGYIGLQNHSRHDVVYFKERVERNT